MKKLLQILTVLGLGHGCEHERDYERNENE